MSKRFWYATKKELDILKVYYKLEDDKGGLQFYQTQTKKEGNKRTRVMRALMRNNWPVVTNRLKVLNPITLKEVEWKEVDEEDMLGFLKRGNPDDNARSSLLQFFGYSIFTLTPLELAYFRTSFSNLPRLIAFFRAVKKECRGTGSGYTSRGFRGRWVRITPAKIKKAMTILFGVDPQEVLYHKKS